MNRRQIVRERDFGKRFMVEIEFQSRSIAGRIRLSQPPAALVAAHGRQQKEKDRYCLNYWIDRSHRSPVFRKVVFQFHLVMAPALPEDAHASCDLGNGVHFHPLGTVEGIARKEVSEIQIDFETYQFA